jgi:hypothetical protein
LLLGARDFAAGLFHGVTGLVVEPVRGAMDDGIAGLGKGMVRGVLGVAVKPVVGVFDAASRTSEGICWFSVSCCVVVRSQFAKKVYATRRFDDQTRFECERRA